MTTIWELFAASIVFAWVLTCLPILGRSIAACHAIAFVCVGGAAVFGFMFGGVFVATFEPFGAMLPIICLAQSAKKARVFDYPAIHPAEKIGWAVVQIIIVAGVLGAVPLNFYAEFYTGWVPAGAAILVAVWALWRQQTHILVAVGLAQLFWLSNVGSSNFYDQITHLILIPALILSAVTQTYRMWAHKQAP